MNKEKGLPEIRSLEEIKAGCEITVNYTTRSLAMKNRETRQNKLSSERGFECFCELCKKESTVSDDEKYERFEKLNHEFDQLKRNIPQTQLLATQDIPRFHTLSPSGVNSGSSLTRGSSFQWFQKYKKGISNLKEMYKLAMEKKPSRSSIDKILEEGIAFGKAGYKSFPDHQGKFFENECEFFKRELKGSVL